MINGFFGKQTATTMKQQMRLPLSLNRIINLKTAITKQRGQRSGHKLTPHRAKQNNNRSESVGHQRAQFIFNFPTFPSGKAARNFPTISGHLQ